MNTFINTSIKLIFIFRVPFLSVFEKRVQKIFTVNLLSVKNILLICVFLAFTIPFYQKYLLPTLQKISLMKTIKLLIWGLRFAFAFNETLLLRLS